jgi:hypothetical protein
VWLSLVLVSGAAGVMLGHGGVPGFESARERQARVQAEQLNMVLAKTSAMERALARLGDAPSPGSRAAAPPLDANALREQVAAAVREALKAEPGRVDKDRDERAVPEPRPENREAFEQAKGVVDTAITAGGRWRLEHARLLRPLLSGMSPDEVAQIHRQLAVAINTGKLVNEMHGPPL